ncbi:sensor histidine kinase [Mycobacterium sp. NPDC003449]
MLGFVVRPTAPPLWLGILVAAGFIAGESVVVHLLKKIASDDAFGALFLLGVLVVSAGWGFRLAVATSLVSAAVYVYSHLETEGALTPTNRTDIVAIGVFLPLALLANVLAGQVRLRAAESERHRLKANALAGEQAALRRVATMVARGTDRLQVYPAAVTELSGSIGVDNVALLQYESDEAVVLFASRDERGCGKMHIGERISLIGDSVAATIRRTGAAARIDSYDNVPGSTAARMRQLGIRSAIGAPIIVDGRVRGALMVGSLRSEPMPTETEARIGDFADLLATAIANTETREELIASRARIVTAGDHARRRFERDLHDGAQQRVVSLGLELRALEESIPPEQNDLRDGIAHVLAGLLDLSTELQEISRGIHPAILSEGGLGPAIKKLARRSAVPVTLDVDVGVQMPESVEVTAYYVVAEALTNTAKHARAAEVRVHASARDDVLRLSIADDGVGGAAAGRGSGLIGLKDRVEALAGSLDIWSPQRGGTTLRVVIPLKDQQP